MAYGDGCWVDTSNGKWVKKKIKNGYYTQEPCGCSN